MYKEYTHVSGNDRLVVERMLRFGNDFTTCIKAYLTAKILDLHNKHEVTLDELHEIRKRLFTKSRKLNSAISVDLNNLEKISMRLLTVGE